MEIATCLFVVIYGQNTAAERAERYVRKPLFFWGGAHGRGGLDTPNECIPVFFLGAFSMLYKLCQCLHVVLLAGDWPQTE